MSIRNKELIPATTSLAFCSPFNVLGSATLTCSALGSGEGVQLQYSNDGTDFQTLYLNGVLQELTTEHSILTITGPGKYRVLKSVTASAVSVYLWETEGFQ